MDTNKRPDIIIKPRSPLDYIQGIQTLIPYLEVLPSGDWTPYLPSHEPQKYKFDTNECMTLSAINIIETQCNFLKAKGLFSDEALAYFQEAGYIDANGSFAFSERYSAITNGTGINGNDFPSVWQGFRKNGLLPRSDFNYTLEQSNQFTSEEAMCWDYYNSSRVIQEMKDKAQKIYDYITIQWEWIVTDGLNIPTGDDVQNMIKALKQAPVQIATPACPDWNTGDVHSCGTNQAAHGTMLCLKNDKWNIFDHYNPYRKTLSIDYPIPYAVKGVVTANYSQITDTTVLQKLINAIRKLFGV